LLTLPKTIQAEKFLYLGGESGISYDNNITLSEDARYDVITFFSPGIRYRRWGQSGGLTLGYGFIYFDYSKYSDMNYYSHLIESRGEFRRIKNITLTVDYTYRLFPLTLGLPSDSPSNLVKGSVLLGSAKYKWDFTQRTMFESEIEWKHTEYEGIGSSNKEWNLPVSITQKLNSHSSAGIEYRFTSRDFLSDIWKDYILHKAAVNLKFKFKKTDFLIESGYQWLDFSGPGVNSGPLITTGGIYNFTKRISFKAGYNYTYTLDAGGNPYRGQHGDAGVSHKISERLMLSLQTFFDRYKILKINYKLDSLDFDGKLDYKLTRKYLFLTSGYSYSNITQSVPDINGNMGKKKIDDSKITISIKIGL